MKNPDSRSISAGGLVVAGMLVFGLLFYGASTRFSAFVESFPASAERIRREIVTPVSDKFAKVEETAGRLTPQPSKKITEVKLKEPPAWPSYLIRGFGSASSVVVILAVVPFLTFYMLIRKMKWYQNMCGLLGSEVDPIEFSSHLASMVRRFALGNLAVGAFMGAVARGRTFRAEDSWGRHLGVRERISEPGAVSWGHPGNCGSGSRRLAAIRAG